MSNSIGSIAFAPAEIGLTNVMRLHVIGIVYDFTRVLRQHNVEQSATRIHGDNFAHGRYILLLFHVSIFCLVSGPQTAPERSLWLWN